MPLPASICCPFRQKGADTDQLVPLSPELFTVPHQPGRVGSGITIQVTSCPDSRPDSEYSGSSPAYLSARLTVKAAWDEGKTPDLPPSNLKEMVILADTKCHEQEGGKPSSMGTV